MPRTYRSPTRDAILEVIERDGPISTAGIGQKLHMPKTAICDALLVLRKAKRVVIADWHPPVGSGRWAPLYGVGGKSVPEPAPLTKVERNRRYRQRNKFALRAKAQKAAGRTPVAATWLSGLCT